MKIKLVTIALLLLVFSMYTQASPGYGYHPLDAQAYQQAAGPGEVLREGMTKLLNFMRQTERPNPELIAAFLETEIVPYFDFAYMAQWSAGSAYQNMSGKQKAMLQQKIKTMLLSTLSKGLASYENQDVRFFRPRRVSPNEVKVRMGILQAGGYPAKIDFRFYRGDSGWKIFDVAANGNSAVAYFRQYFTRLARQQGSSSMYRR
jgi:phospholipid transport system substrate-binding protein